jgi:hypothetical protein
MRNADCYSLAKILLPQLPGFVTNKKNEIFIAPIDSVCRGFLFESTAGAREDFYFWWFFMPMVPASDHFHLSFGKRMSVPGGDTGWRTDMLDLPEKLLAAMKPKALPLLRSIHSIHDTIEAIYVHRGTRQITDINVLDNIACLQILDGQFGPALATLEDIIAKRHGTDRRQWILDIVERMEGLRTKLVKDPQLAIAQVKAWQDYTFKALKLENWR